MCANKGRGRPPPPYTSLPAAHLTFLLSNSERDCLIFAFSGRAELDLIQISGLRGGVRCGGGVGCTLTECNIKCERTGRKMAIPASRICL